MNCGCGYELFWRLNPHKLQAFFEAKKQKIKEDVQLYDSFAWLLGTYVRDAFLSSINRTSYPRSPRGLNQDDDFNYDQNQDQDDESRSPSKNMSDGQKFALFMIKHNKALEAKRAKQNQ